MGKFFKKLFDVTLPFSGDKTKLASWILAITGAQAAGIDMKAVEAALASGVVPYGAVALLVIGLVDKQLKKKYGSKEVK